MNLKTILSFSNFFFSLKSTDNNIYQYGSLARRNIKLRYGLKGLVEDHHVIPKEWRNHRIIRDSGYNISESYNIVFMPSHMGKQVLNTNRALHSGGHLEYNKYVKKCLDSFESPEELCDFVVHLKKNLRDGNQDQIPWK